MRRRFRVPSLPPLFLADAGVHLQFLSTGSLRLTVFLAMDLEFLDWADGRSIARQPHSCFQTELRTRSCQLLRGKEMRGVAQQILIKAL